MSGTEIIGTLLRGHAAIAAIMPAERIKIGTLPENTPLNALLIRSVSLVERQMLTDGPKIHTTERVSVTVRAVSYRDQEAIIRLVRSCCRGKRGAIAGVTNVSVLTAGTGPDVRGPGNSFEKTTDFRVSFDADA